MNPNEAYAELLKLSREERVLGSALGLLRWDEEVCMPRRGVENRAEQVALLAGLLHERATNPRYDELLHIIEDSDFLSDADSVEAANVRETRRSYDRETKVPRALVEEMARVHAQSVQSWAEARSNDDFASFAPWLARVFQLAREKADAIGFAESRYDALLDEYEPGMTQRQLSALFGALEPKLAQLVDQLATESSNTPTILNGRTFPVDRQRDFAEKVAAELGYSMEFGRFDPVSHPFCSMIGPGDVRVGMRYNANDFGHMFFAMVHEVGHALYDHGRDPTQYGSPAGEPASLGIHESQSRLWENQVGRSEGFWRHFYPELEKDFPETLKGISAGDFRHAMNRVSRTFIRTQADEVTYNFHVMIRFDLEGQMLAGNLEAKDVPEAWGEQYSRRLGITPKDDRTGCLQDMHWSDGLIGYFPTYTLGNIYAAQLFKSAEKKLGSLNDAFARGEFASLRDWLNENVYRYGHQFSAAQIVEKATGSDGDPSALIDSLRARYAGA